MSNITLEQVSLFLGGIIALCGSIGYFLKPIKTFQDRLEKVEQHQDNDNQRLKVLEEDSRMQLRIQFTMLKHMETGNETGEMAKLEEEINKYLIDRK